MIFQINDIRCENRDNNDFSNFKNETYKYTNLEIFVAKHTKKFWLFQEISMLKKNACKIFKIQINKKCESNFDKIKYSTRSYTKQTSNQKKNYLHFFVQQQTINRMICNWNTLFELFVLFNKQNDYIIENLQNN